MEIESFSCGCGVEALNKSRAGAEFFCVAHDSYVCTYCRISAHLMCDSAVVNINCALDAETLLKDLTRLENTVRALWNHTFVHNRLADGDLFLDDLKQEIGRFLTS